MLSFDFIKARVLYDFDGQPGTAELSIAAGEILNVSSKSIGEHVFVIS
jgi:hypothetical protein